VIRRGEISPPLSDQGTLSLDDIIRHLRAWQADTLATTESLRLSRQRIGEHVRQLESPEAALEYIDFFVDSFDRAAADIDLIVMELPRGVQRTHLDTLRQIASNAAADQRRCLMFRDKWISRPLPYEQVRALLSQIATDTRDQLEDYRELNLAAERLEGLAGPEARPPRDPSRALDRRALFTRWFGR
jgi:hypothetical protein